MANKVNMKFVVALGAVLLVAFSGVAWIAYERLTTTGAEFETRGDKLAAEGNYEDAARMYGRAVIKDRTNVPRLIKWRDTLLKVVPKTRVAYTQYYREHYLGILGSLAALQETDSEVQRTYYDAMFADLVELGSSPEAWLNFVDQLSTTLERIGAESSQAKALHGLRALAQLARSGSIQLTEEDRDQMGDDFNLAIEGEPDSIEFADGLIRMRIDTWRRALRERRDETAEAAFEGVRQEIAAQQARLGPHPRLALRSLQVEMENRLRTQVDPAARLQALLGLRPQGQAVVAAIQQADPATIDWRLLDNGYNTLRVLLERAGVESLMPAMDAAVDAQPLNAQLMILRMEMLKSLGRYDEVVKQAEALLAIPDQPVSRDGLLLLAHRSEALYRAAEAEIFDADKAETTDARAARLASAQAYRDRLLEQLEAGEDAPAIMLLDARLALGNGENRDALERLSALNEATGKGDNSVLRLLAETLRRNGLLGAAREQFQKVIDANPVDLDSLYKLADIEWRLGDTAAAEQRYRSILVLRPDSEPVKERLAQLIAERGEAPPSDSQFANDPVAAAVVAWRSLMREDPPQTDDALQTLLSVKAEHGDDPRLYNALAVHYVNTNNTDRALEILRDAIERYPDDQRFPRLRASLVVNDPSVALQTRLDEIDHAGLDELAANLARADLYRAEGMSDEATAALDQAAQSAPEDPGVIERRFTWGLEDRDIESARVAARDAARLNIDSVDGLLYQARIDMVESKFEQALVALQQAVERIPFDPLALRLLGQTQLRLGRVGEAVDSLARAYDAKPNDTLTGRLYAETLTRLNRKDEALEVTRAIRRLARTDTALNELWLQLEGEVGDRDAAITERRRLAGERPDDTANAVALARMLMTDEQLSDARSIIDTLREANPDSEPIAVLDADWHAEQGDLKAGVDVLRGFLGEDTRPVIQQIRIAQFYMKHNDMDAARSVLEKARPLQAPDERRVDVLLADLDFEQGDYESAIPLYRSFLEVRESQLARRRVVDALIRLERFEEAIAALDEMPADEQSQPTSIVLRARAETGRGDDQAAAVTLDKGIRENPSSALIFAERALHTTQHSGQLEDALADTERAIRLAPMLIEARRLRILLLTQTGRINDALTETKSAIDTIPDDRGLRETQIELLARAGERARAIEAAVQASDRFTAEPGWLVTAGDLAATSGDWSQALGFYQEAFSRDPQVRIAVRLAQSYLTVKPNRASEVGPLVEPYFEGDHNYRSTTRLLAAQAAQKLGQKERALALADESFAQTSTHADLRDWFTGVPDLFDTTKDFVEFAHQHTPPADLVTAYTVLLAKAEATDPARMDSLIATLRTLDVTEADALTRLDRLRLLGQLLYAAGEYQESAGVYQEGLALAPTDLEFNNNLAFLLAQKLHDPEQALEPAETAAKISPSDSSVLDTLGTVYTMLGRLEEAATTLLRAADNAVTPAERIPAYLHLAEALEQSKDTTRARRYAEQALSLLKTNPGLEDEYKPLLESLMARLESAE